MNKGIYDRGYLPHWDFANSVQAITFRLADSIPGDLIVKWRQELASIEDDAIRQKELHRLISKYEDLGHGSSQLWQRDYYDRFIRDEEHLHRCIAYIRRNPVKAGLCLKPEDWPYGSAFAGAPTSVGEEEDLAG